jgi:hypothetical protein
MALSGTIAVWCVPQATSNPIQIETHFNYWHVAASKSKIHDFVEVGIMADNLNQIDEIGIFVPLSLKRELIEDCAPYLGKPQFAQGIFNEPINAIPPASGINRFTTLQYQNNNVFCRVHNFATNNDVIDSSELTVFPELNGTTLTITQSAISAVSAGNAPQCYFRIRFGLERSAAKNPFIKVISTPDGFLQSSFNEIEYLDFRVNEARTLPPTIETRIATNHVRGGGVTIKLIAFLTALPVNSELVVSSAPTHKTRLLEPKIWDKYSAGGIPAGMVVYHWKKEALPAGSAQTKPLVDFSAFVKLQTKKGSFWTLAKYLFFAFCFGLLGNLAAPFVASWCGDLWAHCIHPNPVSANITCGSNTSSTTNCHSIVGAQTAVRTNQ